MNSLVKSYLQRPDVTTDILSISVSASVEKKLNDRILIVELPKCT